MSADLIDLRAKIDELTDEWLHTKEAQFGKDRSEVVRILLHDIASKEVREATLLCNRLIAKGIIKES